MYKVFFTTVLMTIILTNVRSICYSFIEFRTNLSSSKVSFHIVIFFSFCFPLIPQDYIGLKTVLPVK